MRDTYYTLADYAEAMGALQAHPSQDALQRVGNDIALLVKTVREAQARIESLETLVSNQEKDIQVLEDGKEYRKRVIWDRNERIANLSRESAHWLAKVGELTSQVRDLQTELSERDDMLTKLETAFTDAMGGKE